MNITQKRTKSRRKSDVWLSTAEAAAYAGVHVNTIKNALAKRTLVPVGATPGGQHRFTIQQIDRWLKKNAAALQRTGNDS